MFNPQVAGVNPNMLTGMGGTGGSWAGIGKALEGFGDWMKNDPEQFAITADMIGKGFAPNNPFAGVGTALGQSSLANKASQAQQEEQQVFRKALFQALGIDIPGKSDMIEPASGNEMSLGHLEGPTERKYSVDPKTGQTVMTTTEPVKGQSKGAGSQSVNLTDVLPLFNP